MKSLKFLVNNVAVNIQKAAVLVLLGLSILSVPLTYVEAQSTVSPGELLPDSVGTNLGLPKSDIRVTIARIIRVAMSLLGILMVGIVLYGGFLWMTAGGNDDKVSEAKKWISSGVIGLAIILSAYAIATFVINQLVNATSSSDTNFNPISQ